MEDKSEIYYEERLYCSRCHKYYTDKFVNCPTCNNSLLTTKITWHTLDHCYFLKITDRKVIQSLRKGVIWFRPAKYYRDYEATNNAVTDVLEFATLVTEDKIEYDAEQDEKVIFCIYKLVTDKNGEYTIPDNEKALLRQFGNVVSIIDFKKMGKFLKTNVNHIATNIRCDHVMYYTENLTGYINPFNKRIIFSYQNEYRIILQDKKFKEYYDENGELIIDKFEYRNNKNLKKVFSQPLDLELILNSNNEKEWQDKIKMF